MYKIIYIILLSIIINEQLPNDVRWVTKSNEYKALCNQIYSLAIEKINSLDYDQNKHYAVVLDLDETVLDNSQYQIELNRNNESFNMKSWAKWVLREEAKLVPGAYEYIKLLHQKNIQIIYLSNRMNARLNATINNLKKLDIYTDKDIFLLRQNKEDKKYIRRNEIFSSTGRMKNYNQFSIVQYLGDAMGDFESSDYSRFGVNQFIFPNPMYGKW